MGWGEARQPTVTTAADRLAGAVRAWQVKPSTGNADRMIEAADTYERSRQAERVHVHIDAPPPERVVMIPVETGRRFGW